MICRPRGGYPATYFDPIVRTNTFSEDHTMTDSPLTAHRFAPKSTVVRAVAAVAACAILVAGCGSSDAGAAGIAATAPAAAGAARTGPAQARQPAAPTASGTIASIIGTLLQVQGSTSQTAVTYTGTTTFTTAEAAALSEVTVGSCISSFTGVAAGGSAGAATSSDAASAPTTARTTATRVAITDAVNGACGNPGFGGGPGGGPGAAAPSGALPSDSAAPTNAAAPTGGSGAVVLPGGFGNRVSGLVTAVDGSTITVTTAGQVPGPATVTVAGDTTYTKTVSADPTVLVVGQCARAVGAEDSSGELTATSIAVSQPGTTGCNTGSGRGPGGGRGNRAGGQGSAASTSATTANG